jgi:formyl-CoA transferase
VAGGIYGAFHVAAALARRERTGEGCHIDVAASEAVAAHAVMRLTYALHQSRLTSNGALPARDRGRLTGAKYQYYQTADERYVLFCCIEPKFWTRFCTVVDRPDLSDHHDAGKDVDFGAEDDGLRRALQDVMGSRTLTEWLDIAARERLPIGPAHNSALELIDVPQFRSREIFQPGSHPAAGEFTYVGQPVLVRDDPYELRFPAPDLGEHTDDILASLGIDPARIEELRSDGVI